METVDLNTTKSSELSEGSQKPALQFKSDTDPSNPDSAGSMINSSESPAPESPIEGTELKSTARQRSRSGGTSFKEWSVHQIKVTKQLVSERFGRGLRTVDTDLETRIESLRETQRKYAQLMSLMQQFTATFVYVLDTQKSLAEHFAFMSVRAPELHTEFHYNSETQKVVARNGDTLLAAAKFFVSNMHTVCTKTMEDTLQTVKTYESARLSYDAYRTELDELREKAQSSQKAAAHLPGLAAEFEKHKKKFEQLRHDVDVKLKLLDENKVCNVYSYASYPNSTVHHPCVQPYVYVVLYTLKERIGTVSAMF